MQLSETRAQRRFARAKAGFATRKEELWDLTVEPGVLNIFQHGFNSFNKYITLNSLSDMKNYERLGLERLSLSLRGSIRCLLLLSLCSAPGLAFQLLYQRL